MGKKLEAIERAGLAEAVEQAADAIVITDPTGVIQFVNPAFSEITGYSSKEALGQNPRVLKSGQHPKAFYENLWGTIRSGKVWWGEVTNRRKDGTTYLEEMRIAPLKGPQGQIKGYVAIKRDVTERRAAVEAQRFLATIVEGSEDAIFSYSLSGAILTWNRGAEAIFGYSSLEAIGKHVSLLVAPEKLPLFDTTVERLLRGETVPLRRCVALHKEGRRIPVSITSTSIRDSLGEVIAISDILRDESMRQKVEDTRALLATIVESSADAISSTDLDGTILSWNRACELMHGYSRQEVIGKNISALLPTVQQDKIKEILETVRWGGTINPFEAAIESRNGAVTNVSARVAAIRNAAGEVVGSSASLTDITERKRAAEKLVDSERRYRATFEQAAVGIVHTSIDGKFLCGNARFAQIIGYSPEEIPQMTFRNITHPEDVALSDESFPQLKAGETARIEKRYIRKDGRSIWVRLTSSARHDEQGRFYYYITIVEDIHAQKQAEDDLREANERLALATRAGAVGIWDYDIVRKVLIWDDQMFRLYGITRGQFSGTYEAWQKSWHPEDLQRCDEEINAAIRGDRDFDIEFRIVWPDGSFHFIRALALVKRDTAGKAVHMIGTNWEITEEKRAAQALLESNRKLEIEIDRSAKLAKDAAAANDAKSEFLAAMSHEIRTPMNGVIGLTGLLLNTELTKEQRRFAKALQQSGKSLLALINDILDFSKIESGKLELETVDFGLQTLVAHLVAMLGVQAQAKGLQLKSILAPGTPVHLRGDPGRLRQILTNLVGNAIKFTSQGEVTIRTSLAESTDSGCLLRFSVCDTGIGIAQDKTDIIFDRFSQVDSSTTRKFGGTGLGLAISRQLSKAMGGEIGVVSKEGTGSEFWFTARFGMGNRPSEPRTEMQARVLRSNARVLLAEDNRVNQMVALGIVKKFGISADAVVNGKEALHALASIPYDLVLMDVRMPVMDGLEAARMIRDPHSPVLNRAVPIIALTANAMQSDREDCLSAGMNDVVPKPLDPAALLRALEMWLPAARDEVAPACGPAVPAISPQDQVAVFDRQGLLRRVMSDDSIAERVLEAFLFDCPQQIEELKDQIEAGDAGSAGRLAHSIKGASANVGGERLRQLALRMEKNADSGEMKAVKESMRDLEEGFLELKMAIEEQAYAGKE